MKKETLGRDVHGRYRRYLGWKFNGTKLVQHYFRLGRDEAEARRRNGRLESLWDAVVARWRQQRAEGQPTTASPLWDDTTLTIAAGLAKGATPPSPSSPPLAATPAPTASCAGSPPPRPPTPSAC